jgi:nucleolar protein 58
VARSLRRGPPRGAPSLTPAIPIHFSQAIGLLDELDKEVNVYAMRTKEWYGWHFPEMAKVVNDNLQYAKSILKMGFRAAAASTDFGDTLPPEVEEALKEASIVSMGTDISDADLGSVQRLASEVVALMEYRAQLWAYLQARMQAIAPNLTVMVGELVGARLIAHAGSLMNLAKQPASTVQILGAEKALFRALKTKHDTPKYGLIYHASLIGQAPAKHKGKISRVLAAKTALSIRVDALGDSSEPTVRRARERAACAERRAFLRPPPSTLSPSRSRSRRAPRSRRGCASWRAARARARAPRRPSRARATRARARARARVRVGTTPTPTCS